MLTLRYPDFPSIPTDVCKTIVEKWFRFKLTLLKGFIRDLPEQPTDGFVITEDDRMRDFRILFSVLPGLMQHPQFKVEGSSMNFAEQVIALLKNITSKYRMTMETWSKEHPAHAQYSQFITAALISFTRAAYLYAAPLKNCIEVTPNGRNVFDPTQDYTVCPTPTQVNIALHGLPCALPYQVSHAFVQMMKLGLQTLKDCSSCNVEVCTLGKASICARFCCILAACLMVFPPSTVYKHQLVLFLRCFAAAPPRWRQAVSPHRRPGKRRTPAALACTRTLTTHFTVSSSRHVLRTFVSCRCVWY